MLMLERQLSFSATVRLTPQTTLPVIIRTSIPIRPRASRWWGAFALERALAEAIKEGDEVTIIDQNGSTHPAVIVGREENELSFRCLSAFPVPAEGSGNSN